MTETLQRAALEQQKAVEPVVEAFVAYCKEHGLERASGLLAGLINLHVAMESQGRTLN